METNPYENNIWVNTGVENEQCTSKYILWQSVIADKQLYLSWKLTTFSLID